MILRVFVSIVLYVLLGVALWWYIDPGDPTQKKDFAQLMVQVAGGAALLFGLYFTWRRVEVSQRTLETQQDQQVTERFTRAIDQLGMTDSGGNPRLEIRLGGIYALERIAKDSPERDYSTVIKVLMAYVRENAPSSPRESSTPNSALNVATEQDEGAEQQKVAPNQSEPPADIEAILGVLRRREEDRVPAEHRVVIDLRESNLRSSNLKGANLLEANLGGANLEEAHLLAANLGGAILVNANLKGANLLGANLPGAYLKGANLNGAFFGGANLDGAVLDEANLKRANLLGAEGLTQGQLEQAIGDASCKLPEGLDPPASWT